MQGLYYKLSKYFRQSTPTSMADKCDGKTESVSGGGGGGGGGGSRINMRKLSFMNPFTSRQNSEAGAQTPTVESNPIDSPKHRKSISQKDSDPNDTDDDVFHEFSVSIQYLGKIELRNPGLPEIMENVGTTYTSAKPYLKTMDKSILTLNQEGIHINHETNTSNNRSSITDDSLVNNTLESEDTKLYKARRILYCAVDKTHQKVFFFNYQYGSRAERSQLHMVVCKTHKDAKELAKRCSYLFKKIQIEMHKRDKEKREDHIQNFQRIRTRSNQNFASSSTASSTTGSKEGSCSGTYGSGEWVQERMELSMA